MNITRFALAACMPLALHAACFAQSVSPPAGPNAGSTLQLEQWLALDNPGFANLVEKNWPAVEQVLTVLSPTLVIGQPVALGFAGPMRSCLEDQAPLACRIYMTDLVRLNGGPIGPVANPFGR